MGLGIQRWLSQLGAQPGHICLVGLMKEVGNISSEEASMAPTSHQHPSQSSTGVFRVLMDGQSLTLRGHKRFPAHN